MGRVAWHTSLGAGGICSGEVEDGSTNQMWKVFQWPSAGQMRYLKMFILSEGRRYQDLTPRTDLISPNRDGKANGATGWAYGSCMPEKDLFLAYFENNCPPARLSGLLPDTKYRAQWFDPRTGQWSPAGNGVLKANQWGWIQLPDFPAADDWGLKLTLSN